MAACGWILGRILLAPVRNRRAFRIPGFHHERFLRWIFAKSTAGARATNEADGGLAADSCRCGIGALCDLPAHGEYACDIRIRPRACLRGHHGCFTLSGAACWATESVGEPAAVLLLFAGGTRKTRSGFHPRWYRSQSRSV